MALTLTRSPGQTILINGGIRITVTNVHGDKVKLKVEAPPDKRILREELLDRDQPECPE